MKKVRAMLLAALAVVSALMLTSCSNKNEKIGSVERIVNVKKVTMEPYEHIISIPVKKDIRKEVIQYPSYAGYEPAGISATAYGKFSNAYGGGTIIYTNNEPVECSSNTVDSDGAYLFESFGVPEEGEYDNDTPDVKIFQPGEHIISVPKKGLNVSGAGAYKVVGVAETAYGQYTNIYGGGCILCVNVVPVMCSLGPDGYTHFGAPVEEGFAIKKTYKGE